MVPRHHLTAAFALLLALVAQAAAHAGGPADGPESPAVAAAVPDVAARPDARPDTVPASPQPEPPPRPAQNQAPEPPSAPAIGTLYGASHALVIGNDEYTNGWPRLSNAVRDAEQMAVALTDKGFAVELHMNLDSAELADVFKRFFILKGSDREARLFIWYAGHGATVDGEGYLVPRDAPLPKDAAAFKLSALALRDFGTFMRQAVAKHVYAVFDSCFAGTVFTSQRAAPSSAITLATTLPVRQFLTSGDAYQEVSDDGTFRELFLRAINGEERADSNDDGFVTATELGMFLGDRLTNLTQSLQTPRYGKLRDKDYDRGDFVFALPAGRGAPPDDPSRLAGDPGPSRTPRAGAAAELAFWDSVKASKRPEQFRAYLEQYPSGSFARLANLKIEELEAGQPAEPINRPPVAVTGISRDLAAGRVANVRAWPSADARKVGRLEAGARVWAIGEAEVAGVRWYRVARDGLELGFVYGPLLQPAPGTGDTLAAPAGALTVPAAGAATRGQQQPAPPPEDPERAQTVEDRVSSLLDGMIEKTP